jgi:menaquinone-9 beta-reductase
VTGGWYGIGVSDAVNGLMECALDCQVLVTTGQADSQGVRMLRELNRRFPHRLRLIEWSDQMPVLLRAADVVVGADGAHSTVRRLLGIRKNATRRTLIALRGYTHTTPHPGELFLGWAPLRGTAYAWSFPVHDRLANVGFGLPLDRLAGGRAELERRLHDGLRDVLCVPGSVKAHHLPLSSGRPTPYRGRALLVGDAASLINPLTGEGIFYALISGRRAAAAILERPDDPGACYAALIRRDLGRHFRHTGWLAAAGRWHGASDLLVTAAGNPALLDDLAELAFGRGTITPRLGLGIARALLSGKLPLTPFCQVPGSRC